MNTTTNKPDQVQEKTFFDLYSEIQTDYFVSINDAKSKAIRQLKDDIETAVAVLPSSWDLDIYVKVFDLLDFVAKETSNIYQISINKFMDYTPGKIGDMPVTLLANRPALFFSEQGVLMPYLAVSSPGTIVTMDIETQKSTRHDNYFAFVKYCLDVMCKNYK